MPHPISIDPSDLANISYSGTADTDAPAWAEDRQDFDHFSHFSSLMRRFRLTTL